MENQRQICRINSKDKLLEFNDRLAVNDFSEKFGVIKSSVHGKFSRINIVIVDWTKGKKENAIVVQHNIEPSTVKTLTELLVANDFDYFEKVGKYTKKKGYFEQKINFYSKDSEGYSPVSSMQITWESGLNVPSYKIIMENGKGIEERSEDGGVKIKAGSFKLESAASIIIPRVELMNKFIETRDTVRDFESNARKILEKVRAAYEDNLRKKAKEEKEKTERVAS